MGSIAGRNIAIVMVSSIIASAALPAAAQVREPWAMELAERVAAIDRRVPVIDRVVLVPNAQTYLDEVSKWSPQGRWPVLFDDDRFAPIFVRRFAPAEVVRRDPVEGSRGRFTPSRESIERAIVTAWGGDPEMTTSLEAFAAAEHEPPGIVVTSVNDPAWTAAIALAAGRGQPIGWLDDDFGGPHEALSTASATHLLNSIAMLLQQSGCTFANLGDQIEAITVCRRIPGKVEVPAPEAEKPQYLAITDAIGRRGDGEQYAFAGWIFGSAQRAAYTAMCALFLEHRSAACVNTYPLAEAPWSSYALDGAAATLGGLGLRVDLYNTTEAAEDAWLRRLAGGSTHDVWLVNTKGNAGWFQMFDGERCHSHDVPVMQAPAAVHFIHSWSAMNPASSGQIAGQFLEHGAYAFVGSIQEPGLGGFVPPSQVAARLAEGVPLLIASRHWGGSVWRINTFGDPLMALRPLAPERIPAQPEGPSVRAALPELMQEARDANSGELFAQAIRDAALIGEDRVAVELWRHGLESDAPHLASSAALPVLFRLGLEEEFMEAWFELGARDELDIDMLWHLMLPRLRGARDNEDTILALQSNLRGPMTHADLERLAPHLVAAFGEAHARSAIMREIERSDNEFNQRQLQALLRTIR